MPSTGFITVIDNTRETSVTNIPVQDVGAGNFAAVTQDIDEIKDAIQSVIVGTVLRTGFTKTYPESGLVPASPQAQRETKWLVTYRDTTQFLDVANTISNAGYLKVFNFEIPCADLTLLKPNSDEMDTSAGTTGADFVAAIEANVRSPYNHSAAVTPTIQVLSVKHVSRNT